MQDFDPNTPPNAAANAAPDAAAPASPDAAAQMVDVTTETFMSEVIEASQNQLVLLDLWAPWCGPCKQLTPILEKLTAQADGSVRLAKMNIDEHPAVARQLQVQSIPAVFAFKDGRPVDGFMGALPESELKKFIDKHLDDGLGPSPAEALIETAHEALAAGQLADASECFAAALEQEPENVQAMAGLAQAHLAAQDLPAAQAVLDAAPTNDNDPDLAAARAALALAKKMAKKMADKSAAQTADQPDAGQEVSALLDRLEKDENDHQARFDLALAYHGAGQSAAAMDALLDLIARKRDWQDEAARKQLLEFFDAYGATDPLVVAARRRLSSLLFS